jgi:DNA-binding NarL/FixJ family response regulator
MPVVWIIEDNAAFRRATERALRARPGIEKPRAFDRCEDVLEVMAKGDRPQVILLDVGLPGMDGIEGMRQIKRLAPEINIILFTVFEDDQRIFEAICAGASGYLLKSERMQTVMEAIDQAMGGGAPMNPRVAHRVLEMFAKLNTAQKNYGLNERERSVLELMVKGLAKKQIADQLELNLHTVDYAIRCIYQKLHVNCIASAVSLAIKERLIDEPSGITRSRKLTR